MSSKEGSNSSNNSPPSPPSSRFDPVMLQLVVSAAVMTAMTILNPNMTIGPGYNPYPQNHRNVQEHQNENDKSKKRKGQSSQGPSKRRETRAVQAVTTPVVVPTVQAAATPIAMPIAQAPTTGYAGNLPWCINCKYHHCTPGPCFKRICKRCGKKGHSAQNCKTSVHLIHQASGSSTVQACYGCGEIGHFKRNCPKATTTNNINNAKMVLAMKKEKAATDPTATGIFSRQFICSHSFRI